MGLYLKVLMDFDGNLMDRENKLSIYLMLDQHKHWWKHRFLA